MSADGTKLLDEGVRIFDGRINHPTIEGPKMYKRGEYYYIMAPAGGVQHGWQMIARSKNIYGPYEHRVVLHQGDSAVNGPHQGGWVDTPNGSNWFIHFQDLDAYGRIVHLQPAMWVNDWLEIGIDTNNDHIGEPVVEYAKPSCKGDIIEPKESDDFKGERLSLQWQWQAHLSPEFYEMTGDGIRLFALSYKGNNISCAPNVMCEMMKRPNFDVKAVFKPELKSGESIGLAITGGSYTGVSVTRNEDGYDAKQVSYELTKSGDNSEICGESVHLASEELYLKLEVRYPCLVTPYISINDKDYIKLGEPVKYEVSRKSWVGGKIGVWCVGNGDNEGDFGSALLRRIEVE
jgi:beta-xylosidase